MPYTITIPGSMYRALRERDALDNQNPNDQAAFKVFKSAVPRKAGRGHSYVITGEKRMVEYILEYLHSLLGLAEDRIVPAYELGTDLKTLRQVVYQEPKIIADVPRETSEITDG
jgi:hypothetical protein